MIEITQSSRRRSLRLLFYQEWEVERKTFGKLLRAKNDCEQQHLFGVIAGKNLAIREKYLYDKQ